jgi:2,7-dihydroxy-5-methyl-1-naphthoate 7-O-methyltransferase
VGGGTGHVLARLLRDHRGLRGTLADLPATASRSAPTFAQAGVSGRVVTIGQSFFDRLPKGADVYLLRSVLNDWSDQEKVAILGRCAEAVPSSGRVLVAGGVAPAGPPGPLSIDKVLTGGNDTPLDEFEGLVRQAGLQVATTHEPSAGHLVVECRRL